MSTGPSKNPILPLPVISKVFLTWWLMRVPRAQRESEALPLVPFLYRCLMGWERPPLREAEHIKLTFGACRARQALAAAVCVLGVGNAYPPLYEKLSPREIEAAYRDGRRFAESIAALPRGKSLGRGLRADLDALIVLLWREQGKIKSPLAEAVSNRCWFVICSCLKPIREGVASTLASEFWRNKRQRKEWLQLVDVKLWNLLERYQPVVGKTASQRRHPHPSPLLWYVKQWLLKEARRAAKKETFVVQMPRRMQQALGHDSGYIVLDKRGRGPDADEPQDWTGGDEPGHVNPSSDRDDWDHVRGRDDQETPGRVSYHYWVTRLLADPRWLEDKTRHKEAGVARALIEKVLNCIGASEADRLAVAAKEHKIRSGSGGQIPEALQKRFERVRKRAVADASHLRPRHWRRHVGKGRRAGHTISGSKKNGRDHPRPPPKSRRGRRSRH